MQQTIWWILTLGVSVAAIVGYWLIARRQMRAATSDLRRELEQERAITRRVSHRLRDPLTVIYGFSEALIDTDLTDEDEVRTVLTLVNTEALDVTRTVEDLVATKELEMGSLNVRSVSFDPGAEIERAITPFRRLGAEISLECPSGNAESDLIRFRQVIQNLVSNAVRHGGAEITIVAGVESGVFRCTVADDGPGLTDEIRTQFFPGKAEATDEVTSDTDAAEFEPEEGPAPSVAARGDAGALGLGLGVAIAVARSLGGDIEYERVPGLTMFTLALPAEEWELAVIEVAHVPPDSDDEKTESGTEQGGRGEVDDDPGARIQFSDGDGTKEEHMVDAASTDQLDLEPDGARDHAVHASSDGGQAS